MKRIRRILAVLALLTLSGRAQNPAPAEPPKPAPAPATVPAPEKIREVYVPYEDLSTALGDKGQGVFLPYAEFLEMWNRMNLQKKAETEKPPADAVLSSAQFTGRVEGEVVVTEAVLNVESFKDQGYAVLPLAPAGLAISKAETGGAVLRLGEHGHEIILTKKGPVELKFTFLTKLTRNAGRIELPLLLPRAPVTRYRLTVPETGWDFRVAPGGAFTVQPSADGKESVLEFFNGGESDKVTVSWQKQSGGPALTPLLFAESDETVQVSPGAVQTSVVIRWRILRAGVERFVFSVPEPHQVLSVSGENIREWTPGEAKDGAREVTVQLHSPARDAATITVELEAPLSELPATIKAPQLGLRDALRQRGSITVSAAPELDISLTEPAGLSQQAVAPATDGKAPAVLGNFRFLQLPWSLTIAAKRAVPVIEAASAARISIEPDSVSFLTRFDIDVRRAGIFDLRLGVPAGWMAVEATGEAVESSRVTTVKDAAWLDVRLKSRMLGKFSLTVSGRRLRAKAAEDVSLPVFSVTDAERHESISGVFLHQSLDANVKEAGTLKPDDAQKTAPQLPVPAGTQPGGVPVLAFRDTTAAPQPAILTLTQKPARVTGDALALVRLREQTVRYQWWIHYDVAYAPVDGFVISLPQEIQGALRVEGSTIGETTRNYKPTATEAANPAADRVFWRLAPRDRKTGPVTVELSLEVPAPAFEAGKAAEVKLPVIALHGVDQETAQTAVVKDPALEIRDSAVEAMESIDPRELHEPLAGTPDIILAWKQLRQPCSLKLSVTRNEWLPVPQSVITWMVLRTAVSRDGAATTEAVIWVKNNGQQMLTVALPAGGHMLSDVQAAGVPQQPQRRAGSDDLLIKLPATTGNEAGREIPVRFVYEVRPEKPDNMGMSGTIRLEPAVIPGSTVLQTHQTLWLPSDFRYYEFDGAMTRQGATESWSTVRERLRRLVPALEPDAEAALTGAGQSPPAAPEGKGGFTFSVPSDGRPHVLRRLNAAAPVTISYRSRRFDNVLHACGLFAAFVAGLFMLRRSIEVKAVWFAVLGIAPLIAMRLVPPGSADFMESLFTGTVLVSIVWFFCGVGRCLRAVAAVKPSPGNAETTPAPTPTPEDSPPAEPAATESAPESESGSSQPQPPAA